MSEIWRWSALETASRVKARDVSVREVTQAHLDRMAAVNPVINAIAEPVVQALDVADEMDARGVPDNVGPLWGVPVTTKINIDQVGYASSNGIPAYNEKIMTTDSPVVSNFRKGGAVIIGRSNAPEFSMRYHSSNPIFGGTKNPWNPSLTPGGSSGGAAAAVVAGIGAIAHGNDMAGSLRYPAHCCGVATIRPSFGRVPAFNPGAAAERPGITQTISVQGPIARSVGDVRAALQVMSARDSRDPFWTAASSSGRIREAALKIGYCIDPYGTGVDASVAAAMEQAIRAFRDMGVELREVTPPDLDRLAALWGILAMGETHHMMGDAFRSLATPEMRALYEAEVEYFGETNDVKALLNGVRDRVTCQRNWSLMFDDIDLLLFPVSLTSIFKNDSDFHGPDPSFEMRANRPMHVVNVLGLPAASLPTHLEDGVPTGVQLVGPMHDDWFVLDVAERLEKELGTIWQKLPAL